MMQHPSQENTDLYNNAKTYQPRQLLDVVVIGEALIDIVTTPEDTNEHPGGSPANVAYGLARLGISTGLLTSLGADRHGAAVEEHLTGAGVVLLPGSHPRNRTSTATATIAHDGSATYNFDITWDVAEFPILDEQICLLQDLVAHAMTSVTCPASVTSHSSTSQAKSTDGGGNQRRTLYTGAESLPPTESSGSARTLRRGRAYAARIGS